MSSPRLQRLCTAVATALLGASIALLAACTGGGDARAEGPVVLAAASLQEALSEVADAWQQGGEARPRLSFAASSALARQVEGGAPADLYFSADREWMDRLERAGLLRQGTRADLLTGELVLVARPGEQLQGIAALASGRVAVAEPASVPAGRYARAALERLDLWRTVEPRLVPTENVRAALALVERGEVPLAIVYATDDRASDAVGAVYRFPPESHPPIRYPVAVLAASDHPRAEAFRAFLTTPQAQRIFAAHGFGIAR